MVTALAKLPPGSLPGLDPGWSHFRSVPGRKSDAGLEREWHFLDTGDELARLGVSPVGTILAVHGNPTWSYLWRALASATLRAAGAGNPAWRLVAVDQLEMGFSERTGLKRQLAQRVADLAAFTEALELDGPVVTLGHDWGGVVSLGWAIDHLEKLAGVALLNTAVHHPEGKPIPAPLRLAGARGVLQAATTATTGFLDTTLALASPPLAPAVKAAYRSPYRSAARRRGIGQFVADIPAALGHESFPELARIAEGVTALEVPALLLWGPQDPIFSDRYLDDLINRLPHAQVHRYEGAGHLLVEERPYADVVLGWLDDTVFSTAPNTGAAKKKTETFVPLWRGLDARAGDRDVAVIDMPSGRSRGPLRVSWDQLETKVRSLAAGLHRLGVRKGDRVSLLVQPGPTLTAITYACLRIGAVVVVADAGLGIRGLTRAVRGSCPDYIIGQRLGLTAARTLGWPGVRISAGRLPRTIAASLGVKYSLSEVAALGAKAELPEEPTPDDEAAILFTSGSTGPAKGVVYTHQQLSELRDVLATHLEITPEIGLVTGFAPFALLGPALGTRSVTPDMDVSSPGTLTATAVAAAVRESEAGIVFLSPAAILNVVATAQSLTTADREALERVRTFLSTGAPISPALLHSIAELMPNATPHTPYGMTECLLVSDITLDGVMAAAESPDAGVCVGSPIGNNQILVSELDTDGKATGVPGSTPGVLGEIIICAPHLKERYDRLWVTDREAIRATDRITLEDAPGVTRWHRTGDIGHLDEVGRLWVEGRLQHVIVGEHGPIAPVGPEQEIERVPAVRRAAVVGVGPHGLRQAVAVVETLPPATKPALAAPALARTMRESTPLPLAAIFVVPQLPTDVRHNSKIDRSRLAAWAERSLAGRKPGAP